MKAQKSIVRVTYTPQGENGAQNVAKTPHGGVFAAEPAVPEPDALEQPVADADRPCDAAHLVNAATLREVRLEQQLALPRLVERELEQLDRDGDEQEEHDEPPGAGVLAAEVEERLPEQAEEPEVGPEH